MSIFGRCLTRNSGLFLANIFFDQKKRQRTVDINRTQRLERQHSREVDRVTRMESQLDHTSRVWLEQILPNWEKKYECHWIALLTNDIAIKGNDSAAPS
jgi:hypothetical protein